MEWLSVKDAATRLGVSGSRVYQLRKAGVLERNEAGEVSAADVRKHARLTHRWALNKFGGEDRLALIAGGVRERLHPIAPHLSPLMSGPGAVERLDGDMVAALGFNCVFEAAKPDTAGCRWCWANIMFRANGGVDPMDTPVYRALFAGEPCPRDRKRWAEREDALVAAATAGEVRREQHLRKLAAARKERILAQAEARLRRDSAIVAAARAATVRVTRGGVTASVTQRPAQPDDDGAALTASVLAKLERRRNAAVARGDQTSVATLNGQISRLRMGDR